MDSEDYNNQHSRTIIHIDLDCFYAQVEMLKKPELRNVPLGIQQKNIVVTSNYKAREFGVRKCMLLTDAKQICPNLVIVNGENLNDYRTMSYKVTNLLQKYSDCVERLGLDENFVDVSKLVREKLKSVNKLHEIQVHGHTFGDTEHSCDCGCEIRLKIGTQIAEEMRKLINEHLGLTGCAGIGHNKLLAKIACSKHKPNEQTVVFPNASLELMLSLKGVHKIPGIGKATSEILKKLGIESIQSLQNVELTKLSKMFDADKAKFLKNLSLGLDNTSVKRSGKPLSIGLEDSCKLISAEKEVKEKLTELLKRLLLLVDSDGRIPKTIKLTIRKFDKLTKTSRRETKQSSINPNFFTSNDALTNPVNIEKILSLLMSLFRKLVQVRRPFHITLLGLSFTKFNERPSCIFRNSVASFLRKDLEVQSITSIENLNTNSSSPESLQASPSSYRESISDAESNEPTPKRARLAGFKRNFMDFDTCEESALSLPVQNLHLNSDTHDNNQNIKCPPNVDEKVFCELPVDVQRELWADFKRKSRNENSGNKAKKVKGNNNTLLNYFVKE